MNDYVKYIVFVLSILAILIKEFVQLKRGEEPAYKKYSAGNWILLFLTLSLFTIGMVKSFRDDTESRIAGAKAEQKRKDDSVLLSRRWVYDTTKFKELLDSSQIIISNGLNNLNRSNQNLQIAENILKSAQLQSESIEENIFLTNKLNFTLPYSIPFKFQFKYDLDNLIDSSLIKYLDSTSKSNNLIEEANNSIITFNYKSLDHKTINIINEIVYYFLFSEISFVKKEDPILRLKSNYILKIMEDDTTYESRLSNSIKLYYVRNERIVIVSLEDFELGITQERKVGITSLMDLDKSYLYITSSSIFGNDFDHERVLAHLILNIDSRQILFGLYSNLPTKEFADDLRRRGIITGQYPLFFNNTIDEKTLRGYRKSLKNTTNSIHGFPAGLWFINGNKYKPNGH